MVAPPHRDQAFCDESAVEPDQRRDIRDRAERDVMQHAEQIGLGHLAGPEAALAQLAIDRDQRHQHETDRGEMAKAGEIVEPVRIDQRIDLRQLRAGLMMIDHHHGHAKAPGFRERLDAGGAAIDGDEQRRALCRQPANGLDVGAVALENAIGNVDQRIESAMPQVPGQQRGRGGAVDVVVAEDRDLLALRRRIRDPPCGGFHLRHGERVRHELADGRIEEVSDSIDIDTAACQHPRQQLRQLVLLHDGERLGRPTRVQPVAPELVGERARHAQERLGHFDGQGGGGRRHESELA